MFYALDSTDKSLDRSASRCILFDGEIISSDASLVIYIYSINIPPIMIINRIYETQSSVAVASFLPGRAKDLSAPLYVCVTRWHQASSMSADALNRNTQTLYLSPVRSVYRQMLRKLSPSSCPAKRMQKKTRRGVK